MWAESRTCELRRPAWPGSIISLEPGLRAWGLRIRPPGVLHLSGLDRVEKDRIISIVGSNIELVKSGNISSPRREIDDGTLRRCDFIVALSKEQAIDSQQGDIYWPVQHGVIGWDKVIEIAD